MSVAVPLTGSQYYDAVTTLLSDFEMDTTLFYQFLNTARSNREFARPWMRLRKFDTSQTAVAAQAPIIAPPTTNKLTLPTDFGYLMEDGEIVLYDQNNTYETFTEIGMQNLIPYLQVNNCFYIDHAAGFYYLLGTVDRSYTVFFPYIADFGDITATTTWNNIPGRFNMILAYDVASMFRLGVDYDDVNARNAEDNNRQASILFNAMCTWDDNLARSATTRMGLPRISDVPGSNFNHKVNTQD